MATKATLINPKTGAKIVVDSGSQTAQQYFGQGFVLDTGKVAIQPGSAPSVGSSLNRTLTGTTPVTGVNPQGLTMEQANDPKYWQGNKYIGVEQTPSTTPQIAPGSSITPSQPERSLGYQKSPLQAYQDLLKQGTRLAFDQGMKPTDILQQYASVGVPLTVPGAIGGAISQDTRSRAAQIGDIYTSTMNTIQEKQKSDAEYSKAMMEGILKQAPDFITSITKDEFEIMQTGKAWTPEMQQKLQVAQQNYQATQAPEGPSSFQEWTLAGGQQGTGKSYAQWVEPKSETGGLTPGQINTTVNSIAGAFDNETIVKSYNTTQEGYQTIKSIGVNTSSPADDIAFIYAFAKIMDPNSVVREGEYNTIQKYAQTWADNFGFSAKRIFSNTNFLGADAKQKMLNALQPKVTTIENQYNNLKSEYQRQIDDAYAGKPRQITSYSSGETTQSNKADLQKAFESSGISGSLEEAINTYGEDKVREVLGLTKPLSMGTTGSGMRTDRHNNPTAFTTDVAKTAGLKEGVDYTVGDSFGGGKYATAKLLGDPIDTTIKVIDKIGFQTQAGKPRWDYIDLEKSQWDSLDYNKKKEVIKRMYQREGGSQLNNLFA